MLSQPFRNKYSLLTKSENENEVETEQTRWMWWSRILLFCISSIFLLSFGRKYINMAQNQENAIIENMRNPEQIVGGAVSDTVVLERGGSYHDEANNEMKKYRYQNHLEMIDYDSNPNVDGIVAIHRYTVTPEEDLELNFAHYDETYFEFLAKYFSRRFPICVDIISIPFNWDEKAEPAEGELEMWKSYDAIFPWGMWPVNPVSKHLDELPIIVTRNMTMLFDLRDKRKIIDYVKPLDHIIPRPISLAIHQGITTQEEVDEFVQNVKDRHPNKKNIKIRCKRTLTSGARDQDFFKIDKMIIENLPDGVCQVSLDPHDIYVVEGFVSPDGELLDLQINIEFDVTNDHMMYYRNGYFGLRKVYEEILEMDPNSEQGKLYHSMVKYVQEFIKIIPFVGIFVMDFLFHDGQLYFLEINPRIGGSSYAFDKQLRASYLDRVVSKYLKQFEAFKDIDIPTDDEFKFWKDIYVEGNYERLRPKPEDVNLYNQLFNMPAKCKDHPVWQVTPWGECSELCDGGIQARVVSCSNTEDESKCKEKKPKDGQECNTETCDEMEFYFFK